MFTIFHRAIDTLTLTLHATGRVMRFPHVTTRQHFALGQSVKALGRRVLTSLSLLLVCASAAASDYVGVVAGEFRVSESGAATYQVPLTLPGGRAGVQPQVAISYNSQNLGQGPLGVGWSLSVGSAITRCASNPADDNTINAIKFDTTDHFCLDGQRLHVRAGVKGRNGTTYRVEMDNFATITSYDNNSDGNPRYFTVETKSGETHYYGDAYNAYSAYRGSDGYLTNNGNSSIAKMWMLKAIEDVAGNYITYHYAKDTAKGTVLIDKIKYAGHTDGYAPFAEVEFDYVTDSSYAFAGYYFGQSVLNNKRLDKIVARVDGVTYREYRLDYDLPVWSNPRTYLTSIEECAPTSATNATLKCKPETVFDWQKENNNSTYHAFPQSSLINSSLSVTEHRLFDINADGIDDIVYESGGAWRTQLTYNGYRYLQSFGSGSNYRPHAIVMDINADGARELVTFQNGPVKYARVVNGSAQTGVLNNVNIGYNTFKEGVISADVNGDGREDMVFRENGSIWAYVQPLQRGGPWAKKSLYTFANNSTPMVNPFVKAEMTTGFDVNGDGRTDFIFEVTRRHYFCQFGGGIGFDPESGGGSLANSGGNFASASMSGANAFSAKQSARNPLSSMPSPITDESSIDNEALHQQTIYFDDNQSDSASAHAYRVPASSSLRPTSPGENAPQTLNDQWSCISSGGIWTYNILTEFEIYLSSGDVNNPTLQPAGTLGSADVQRLTPVDFNGDGLTDVAFLAGGQWRYRLSTGTYFQTARLMGLSSNASLNHRTQFVDTNQDGRTDVLYASTSQQLKVYMSKPHATDNGQVGFYYRGTLNIGSNDFTTLANMNQDNRIDLVKRNGNRWDTYHQPTTEVDDTISSITNGFGVKTEIDYRYMNDPSVYIQSPTLGLLPEGVISPANGAHLVYKVHSDIAANQQLSVQYGYGDYKLHIGGRGALGFGLLRTTDLQTNVVTETTYHQAVDSHNGNGYALIGMPLTTEQKLGNIILSSSTNQLDVRSTYTGGLLPYIDISTENGYAVDTDATASKRISQTVTDSDYDSYGNLTESTVTQYDTVQSGWPSIITETVNEYGTDPEPQRTGRLSQTDVTKTRGTLVTARRSTFKYNTDGMLVSATQLGDSETSNYAASDKRYVDHALKTLYGYDNFGNKQRVCTTPNTSMQLPPLADSQSELDYASHDMRCADTLYYHDEGRYVQSKVDGFNSAVTYTYNGATSAPSGLLYSVTTTSPNAVATTAEFDTFGRQTKTLHADGRQTTNTQAFSWAYGGYFMTTTTETGAPTSRAYMDKWGRDIATTQSYWQYGTAISTLVVRKTYDNQGRLSTVSMPNNASSVTLTQYDLLGRTTSITRPDLGVESISYVGEHTITTNALGQQSRITKNGFGETASSTDDFNKTVYFTYDEYSQLLSTSNDFNSQEIKTKYDSWGRKVETSDPDMGAWVYEYNAYGEMTRQTDAENQLYTFTHDRLGRVIKRYSASEGTTCWGFGNGLASATHKRGRLVYKAIYPNSNKACSGSASEPSGTAHQIIRYTYDGIGRISQQETVQAGENYVEKIEYHATTGNIDVVTMSPDFPNPTIEMKVKHEYNAVGGLQRLSDVTSSTSGPMLWEAKEYNYKGQLYKTEYGNGAQTTRAYNALGLLTNTYVKKSGSGLFESDISIDLVGNVTQRDTFFRRTNGYFSRFREVYTYDDLNRIKTRTFANIAGNSLSGNFTTTQQFNYNSAGNLTFKTGMGHYKYDSAKPNRLKGIYNNSGFYGNPLNTMQYDDNGNITSDGARSFVYTAFNKPSRITKGSTIIDMTYGVDREMTTKVHNRSENGSQVITTHTYIGGYEKIIKSTGNGVTEHKFHIMGGNVVVTKRSNNTSQTFFMHKDTQGSVGLVTDMALKTNLNWGTKAQYIYEPFGKQTSLHIDSVLSGITYQQPSHQGYTGHHEMGSVGIIHMKGRIYDPSLGRFLQADPNIQAPSNTQNYNRYSYVLNNPMSYTDPSGFFFKKLWQNTIGKVYRAIAKVPILNAAIQIGLGITCGPACVAMYNAEMSYAVTGSLGAAIKAGIVSYATSQAFKAIGGEFTGDGNFFAAGTKNGFGHILAHAMVGGVSSVLQGGKFGHGFFSAGLTKGLTPHFENIGGSDFEVNGYNVAEATVAGILGGTISKATGGKFANGAITAAMGNLFNAQRDRKIKADKIAEQAALLARLNATDEALDNSPNTLANEIAKYSSDVVFEVFKQVEQTDNLIKALMVLNIGVDLLNADSASAIGYRIIDRDLKDTFGKLPFNVENVELLTSLKNQMTTSPHAVRLKTMELRLQIERENTND